MVALTLAVALAGCAEPPPESGGPGSAGESVAQLESCTGGVVVTGSGAGPIALGMPVAELRATCAGRDTTISLEGMNEDVYVLPLDSGGSIMAMLDGSGRVSRLTITGRGPATPEGVGAGSMVSEAAAAYPDGCLMPGEGRMVLVVPGAGVSFQTGAPVGVRGTSPTVLPDSTTIAAVYVHGEEAGCP